MIAVLGFATAHPKLVPLIMHYSCISLLGRIWIAFDRYLEYINLLQQKRGTAFRSFDSQLQFSNCLKPLIHCDAAWKTVEGAGTGLDDGIPTFLYNDVSQMRRKLREHLGTDLTLSVLGNKLWHTGNAVPLDGGDYRERKPWEYVKQVWFGNSAGCGRSSEGRTGRMHWRAWVRDFLDNHWL